MYNIVIFGTGKSAEKVLKAVRDDTTDIIAFVDNNYNKHGKVYKGKTIVAPSSLLELEFDYVLIAIIKFLSVKKQLLEMGIPEGKILPYFDSSIIDDDVVSEMINTTILLRDYYEYKIQQLTIEMTNKPYEILNEKNEYTPEVFDIEHTMRKLLDTDCSISRFGDGEIKLIAGQDIGFQKASKQLSIRLKEVLQEQIDNHIVGILNVFGSLSKYTEELQNYFRSYLYEYNRDFQYGLLNKQRIYYDAFITRPYISYKNREHAASIFEQFKRIWQGKKVLVVEGERTRLGRGNDLFDGTMECRRIIAPNENAFEKYDSILECILKQGKDNIVLLALGPTATILAYDLAKMGYRAIDIGHIDIEYEWYRMGATEKVAVQNKYTNEAYGGNGSLEYIDEEYEKQIIEIINN